MKKLSLICSIINQTGDQWAVGDIEYLKAAIDAWKNTIPENHLTSLHTYGYHISPLHKRHKFTPALLKQDAINFKQERSSDHRRKVYNSQMYNFYPNLCQIFMVIMADTTFGLFQFSLREKETSNFIWHAVSRVWHNNYTAVGKFGFCSLFDHIMVKKTTENCLQSQVRASVIWDIM